jgi:hypothetical protein
VSDNLDRVWEKFHRERVASLFDRFPGFYRAEVVETNDPLQWHRVRFRCPELHDSELKAEDLPWADKAPELGGKNTGAWRHPCIGDIVWITFEKNHAYGPIWVGFATGTRRMRYVLESIYTKSPLAVKMDGTPDRKPNDYDENYLPKDGRPMSHGTRDRYGNVEQSSSVGFFPVEHKDEPTPAGQDAVSKKDYETGKEPKVNDPDCKFHVRQTKYGHYEIMADIGYFWKKDGDYGEFEGDFEKDQQFEIDRYKFNLKLLNPKPKTYDAEADKGLADNRRIEWRTRAGHKMELRDVGWAQKAGGRVVCEDAGECKSREGEYGEPRVLSKYEDTDERWMKFRTKGGHIFQLFDIGFHPEQDNFYKATLLEDSAQDEDETWMKRDARQMRFITRWGIKLVLDDRGTHGTRAEIEEKPRGNGWLFKTRRSWQTEPGDPRGFSFDACDKDELDTTRWCTPKSKLVELNDKKDYVLVCTDLAADISRPWQKLKENEFPLAIGMTYNPEDNTYHCKLDKANGYIRLKTAAGRDNGRRNQPEPFPDAEQGLQQGFEARDGRCGSDGPWSEIVDIDHRGMWFSRRHGIGIWRSSQDKDMYITLRDRDNSLIIRNNEDGKLQIFCQGDIEIVSQKNIALKAAEKITLKAGQEIAFEAGSSGHARLDPNVWQQDVPDLAPEHRGFLPQAAPGGGAQFDAGGPSQVLDPEPITQDKREPDDRGMSCNQPFEEVPESVVKVCE